MDYCIKHEIIIAPQSGAAFKLKNSDKLRVIDLEGQQVADLLAFKLNNPREYLSTGATIDSNCSLSIGLKESLYSNQYNPMMLLLEDTVGRHDLLHPPCSPEMYRRQYGVEGNHPSCYINFKLALNDHGLDETYIRTPFNVFMNTHVYNDGKVEVREPVSKPGDYILLEAKMDLLVAVTACSVVESECNAFKPTSIKIEILA